MKMQALVAVHALSYKKRRVFAGGTFYATPRDARILVALKKAQIDPAVDPESSGDAHADQLSIKEIVTDAVSHDGYVAPKRGRGRPRKDER